MFTPNPKRKKRNLQVYIVQRIFSVKLLAHLYLSVIMLAVLLVLKKYHSKTHQQRMTNTFEPAFLKNANTKAN